jgi:hypothetical protein
MDHFSPGGAVSSIASIDASGSGTILAAPGIARSLKACRQGVDGGTIA